MPMFGKDAGERLGKLEFREVIAICDHLGFLLWRQLEHEILWETVLVAFDLLIQASGGNSASLCQVGIYDHFLTSDEQDPLLDRPNSDY